MHKSKFLALLLAIAMVASMVVVPVYAEDVAPAYGLTAGKTTVAPGESFTVTLSMTANPGLLGAEVEVAYEEGLTVTGTNADLWQAWMDTDAATDDVQTTGITPLTTSKPEENYEFFSWTSATAEFNGIGKLATLTFQAPAEEGTYEISTLVGTHGVLPAEGVGTEEVTATAADPITITVLKDACPEHNAVQDWTIVNAGDWTDGFAIPSGHYKLNTDIELTAVDTRDYNNALVIGADKNVCIDLNGHNITVAQDSNLGSRVFHVLTGGNLTVLDSTAETVDGVYTAGKIADGMVRCHAATDCADVIFGRNDVGGNVYVQTGGVFTLHSGIIADGLLKRASNSAAMRGANIYGEAGSTINIKGGEVKDGHVAKGAGNSGNTSYHGGGNIASEGILNITGGTISGGLVDTESSAQATVALFGGNILMVGTSTAHATLNITGGTITGGTVSTDTSSGSSHNAAYGGNIYGNYADITITDATISNGTVQVTQGTATAVYGGNIAVDYGNMTISGSTVVSGGVAAAADDSSNTHGGNISFVNITKFVLEDDVQITGAKMTVYGAETETLNTAGTGANVYARGVSETVNGTVEIHDNVSIPNGQGGSARSYAIQTNYYTDMYVYGGEFGHVGIYANATEGKGDNIYLYAGKFVIGMSGYTNYVHVADCACGETTTASYGTYDVWQYNLDADGYCATCDHTYENPVIGSHVYAEIVDEETAEGTGKYACSTCGAALTCSAHADATWTAYTGQTDAGHYFMTGDVDLGGNKTIKADICIDCNGYTIYHEENARLFTINSGYTLSFQGYGTIDARAGGAASSFGSNIANSGTLTMKDMTVMGGGETGTHGGNIRNGGTLNLENCTVIGGSAKEGGNISFSTAGATGTFTNCTITGGTAATGKGGNIEVYAEATLTMTNCVISGGTTATNGGNVYFAAGTGTFTNCTFEGGTATEDGGSIYIAGGAANFTDCTITDGNAGVYGGNIYVDGTATGTFTDCTVTGGVAGDRGGNYSSTHGTSQITIDGGTYADGQAQRGGNIFLQRGFAEVDENGDPVMKLTVTGGAVIKDGYASDDGGNICVLYANIDLDDCVITGGTATNEAKNGNGGNIAIVSNESAATLIIGGKTTVSGGDADSAAKDIHIRGGVDYCATCGGDGGECTTCGGDGVGENPVHIDQKVTIESGANVGVLTYDENYIAWSIAEGVTSLTALPTIHSVKSEGEYVTKTDLAAAVTDAKAVQGTVVLGQAETADLTVEDYTLDLNGQTLTGTVNAASSVIDSTEGEGVILGDVTLSPNNAYLPVPVEGGYRFESVNMQQKIQKGDTSWKLKFIFADTAEETLLDDVFASVTEEDADEIQVRVTLTWEGCETPLVARYTADYLNAYAAVDNGGWGSKMFTCTINNVDNVSGLEATATIYIHGVEVAATDLTNN